MLMFQMMSDPAGGALDFNSMLPMLMMDSDEDSETMMLVLLSSMSGAASYESNFNLMLPLALKDCDDATDQAACEQDKTDMMVLLMMMSSQSPSSTTTVDSLLPMLLMKDDSNNENLLYFMMMNNGQECIPALEQPVFVEPVAPEPVDNTVIYRTWRLNDDGTRTLISEGEE